MQLAKPEPIARTKRRKQRQAAKLVKSVRAQCVDRDGYCRFGNWEDNPDDWHSDALEGDECDGPSEWAHLGESKRFKTRGMDADARHTTAGSLMLCKRHHDRYDGRRKPKLSIVENDANFPLTFIGVGEA